MSKVQKQSGTSRRPLKHKGLFSRFRRNEDGVTAVEFALISLPFFAVLFAVIELGMIFFAEMMIDNGMNKTARLIRTGQAQAMSQGEFKQQMCSDVFLINDCLTSVVLDVRSFDNFGDIVLPDLVNNGQPINNPSYDPGARRQVVVVRAVHGWDLLIPNITNMGNMGTTTKRFLATSATFRNEPF